ncbi:unnamed protein product, partial [Laminaria digitata]
MKWRAQAGYRTDAVYNRTNIFARELALEVIFRQRGIEASSDMNNSIHPEAVLAAGGTPAPAISMATSYSAAVVTADIISGCRLWLWVARIEALCEDQARKEKEREAGAGVGVGVGAGG